VHCHARSVRSACNPESNTFSSIRGKSQLRLRVRQLRHLLQPNLKR
jgi:hypothetical protein